MSEAYEKLGVPTPSSLKGADKAYAQYVRNELATVISVAVAVSIPTTLNNTTQRNKSTMSVHGHLLIQHRRIINPSLIYYTETNSIEPC